MSNTFIPPPLYVTRQAEGSKTFVPPPLDGSVHVNEWIDWHIKHSPDHPYLLLVGEGNQENVVITWREAGEAVHDLAKKIAAAVPEGCADENGKPRTIGVLASTDTLAYSILVLAILRAGFEAFPLSPRNSAPALHHLITTTSAEYLFGSVPTEDGAGTSLEKTTQAVIDELVHSSHHIKLLPVPRGIELFPRLASEPVKPFQPSANFEPYTPLTSLPSFSNVPKDDKEAGDWPCIIIHSSGSTKFPKPIKLRQHLARLWCLGTWYGEFDACGIVNGAVALPSFHCMGFGQQVGVPLTSGAVSAIFYPTNPPKVPTPKLTLEAWAKAGARAAVTMPSYCEEWSHDEEAIKQLGKMQVLMYGGGPLSEETGDRLVQQGVPLQCAYGATETGIVMQAFRKEVGGKDWMYGCFSSFVKPKLIPQDDGNVVLQLISWEHHRPALINLPKENGYDTNDLLRPHPTRKGFYRIIGRSDDQIMMANGEKTNPGPLENIISASSIVKAAIMFGRGHTQVGVIIEPEQPVDISTDAAVEEFRNTVWPDVEKANAFAPSHSRIFKELIVVGDPVAKPFKRTPKGTIVRNVVLRDYEKEIETVYDEVKKAVRAEWAKPPEKWDEASIRAFVHRIVNGIVKNAKGGQNDVDPDRDLFEQGCDSLQATFMRNAFLGALRHAPHPSDDKTKKIDLAARIPTNFVFEHPTENLMADFIVNLIHGDDHSDHPKDIAHEHVKAIVTMIDKYSHDFPDHKPQPGLEEKPGEGVLITGTTGTLGVYLLAGLLRDPKVNVVYAVNRKAKGKSVQARQAEAFEDKGEDVELLSSNKLQLLEADTSISGLGLDDTKLNEIRQNLTAIIHNAWRLDFNLQLVSFESNIRGVRNLVDLALQSPRKTLPQIFFTSSIGSVSNWQDNTPVPEEPIADPFIALGNGYGEGKYVSDRILFNASERTGIRTTSFRIGQLCGSRKNGAWSLTDWVPHIVKAGPIMGVLPLVKEGKTVAWLPIDVAAGGILDALYAPYQGHRVLHPAHPKPVPWNSIFRKAAEALNQNGNNVTLIPYVDWFNQLEQSSKDEASIEINPAIKLLDFFRNGLTGETQETDREEALGFVTLETKRIEGSSKTMANATSLDQNDVLAWLKYWGDRGLFSKN